MYYNFCNYFVLIEIVMDNVKIAECYVQKAIFARKAGKEFSMSFTNFANLKNQTHCAYSGIEFTETGDHTFSFERIDNSIGYVDGNVIPVSRAINSTRGSIKDKKGVDEKIKELTNKKELNDLALKILNQKLIERENKISQILNDGDLPTISKTKWVVRANSPEFNKIFNHIREYEIHQCVINKAIVCLKQHRKNLDDLPPNARKEKRKKVQKLNLTVIAQQEAKIKKHQKVLKRLESVRSPFFNKLKTRVCYEIVDNQNEKINLIESLKTEISLIKKEIEQRTKNNDGIEKGLKYMPYVLNGIEKFSNLSEFDKKCLKLGYPLGTSRVKILKQIAANKIANEIY